MISTRPRFCRRCKRGDGEVRFAPLMRTRCVECSAAIEAELQPGGAFRKPAGNARDRKARKRPGECSAHLAWIRSLPCATGEHCGTVIHAHHVRDGNGAGTGLKPADKWTVPLCPKHHGEIHRLGAKSFERKYKIELKRLSSALAEQSPHLRMSEVTSLQPRILA